MRISTIGRLCGQGLVNLARNWTATFITFTSAFITFFMLGASVLFVMNLSYASQVFLGQLEARVYLQPDATRQQALELAAVVRGLPGVKSVQLVTKEQALAMMSNLTGVGDALAAGLPRNPLPDALRVRAERPEQLEKLAHRIEGLAGVDKVDYGKAWLDRLLQLARTLSVGALAVLAMVAVGVLFLIVNTVRLTILARRREIEIMQLVGASSGYIRLPFVFESFAVSLAAAALSAVALRQAYLALATRLEKALPVLPLLGNGPMLGNALLALVAAGAFIGVLAGLVAIRRYLRT
ncbi:MAG: ABC transporter permease [Firmicutes bacterium]|nr:ABC transporter permease [Bacillota bacterium]